MGEFAKKIAIVVDGTRGDVQPYIALALALKAERNASQSGSAPEYDVRMITNVNHKGFVDSFGIGCDGAGVDLEARFRDKQNMGKAFMGGAPKLAEYLWGDSIIPMWQALDAFQPDLLVYGMTTIFLVAAWCEANGNHTQEGNSSTTSTSTEADRIPKPKPKVGLLLQLLVPTRSYPPAWFAPHTPYTGKLDTEEDYWSAWKTFFEGWSGQCHCALMTSKIAESNGTSVQNYAQKNGNKLNFNWDDATEFMSWFSSPDSPIVFGVSPAAALPPPEGGPEPLKTSGTGIQPPEFGSRHILSGFLSLTAEQQFSLNSAGFFGGGIPPGGQSVLGEFLQKNSTKDVVYCGWGSMTGSGAESHAKFTKVVRVLKALGNKCGVLVGSGLQGQEDFGLLGEEVGEELSEYVKSSILFRNSAPHEWLFPRCACVIHHGGCGTTACSMKSGKPTIIMPHAMDQKQWSANVNKLGVGVGFDGVNVSEEDLGNAIARCCGDDSSSQMNQEESAKIKKNAAILGQMLRDEENGATRMAAVIRAELGIS